MIQFLLKIFQAFVRFIRLALVLIAMTFATFAHGQTILRVDRVNGSPGGDGTGWGQDAFMYLWDAIDASLSATPPVQIWVAAGTYKPDENAANHPNPTGSRSATFNMYEDVTIYGGFAGSETDKNQRNYLTNVCILSGEINTGSTSDNSYHVVSAIRVDASAKIDGFTIRDGNAIGAPSPETGISGNAGGGMLLIGDLADQVHCIVLRCTFISNIAYAGGAVMLRGSTFATPQFWNCIFKQNEAVVDVGENPSGIGGAFFGHYNDPPDPEGSTEWRPSPFFYNCLFDQNTAGSTGGAAYFALGQLPTFRHCTIVRNDSDSITGGLFHENTSVCPANGNGHIKARESLLWANTSPAYSYLEQQQIRGARVMERSCVQDLNQDCHAIDASISSNPSFVNQSSGDFHLNANSPCINLGLCCGEGDLAHDLWQKGSNHNNVDLAPDLSWAARGRECRLDAGCYEFVGCLGDVSGSTPGVPDGMRSVPDMLYVINNWQLTYQWNTTTCGGPSLAGDITGPHCIVNLSDLMAVLDSWGPCPGESGDPGAKPTEVVDCMEICGGDDECFYLCLCGIEFIECD